MVGNTISGPLDVNTEIRNSIELIISQLSSKGIAVNEDTRIEIEKIGLPIYSARSLPFDPKSNDHRKGNQIGLGFPFTSKEYKWPTDSRGEPKQPIIQLNLAQASQLLGCDLGGGLIQLWTCADVLESDAELELIRIEADKLSSDLDQRFPQSSIWSEEPIEERMESAKEKAWHWDTSKCRFHDDGFSSPLIEWVYRGVHFPKDLGAFKDLSRWTSLKNYPDLLSQIDEIQQGPNDYFWRGLNPQLGGYTNDWGRNAIYSHFIERPDSIEFGISDSLLLFCSQWDNGIGTSGVYIKARKFDNGSVNFEYDIYERFEK